MSDSNTPDAAEKLRIALEMFGLGESMMRETLRRAHPDASEIEIEEKISAWLSQRPGAENGDCPGKLVDLSE